MDGVTALGGDPGVAGEGAAQDVAAARIFQVTQQVEDNQGALATQADALLDVGTGEPAKNRAKLTVVLAYMDEQVQSGEWRELWDLQADDRNRFKKIYPDDDRLQILVNIAQSADGLAGVKDVLRDQRLEKFVPVAHEIMERPGDYDRRGWRRGLLQTCGDVESNPGPGVKKITIHKKRTREQIGNDIEAELGGKAIKIRKVVDGESNTVMDDTLEVGTYNVFYWEEETGAGAAAAVQGRTWSLSRKAQNRLMHVLNGNISWDKLRKAVEDITNAEYKEQSAAIMHKYDQFIHVYKERDELNTVYSLYDELEMLECHATIRGLIRRARDEPERKKATPADPCQEVVRLLNTDQHGDALTQLQGLLSGYTTQDGAYCVPRRVGITCKEDEWKQRLLSCYERLTGLHSGSDSRAPRVSGVRSGTGDGKTHALLAAGELFGGGAVYTTYNLEQSLEFDTRNPRVGVLLRVLLRLLQVSNVSCNQFLARNTSTLLALDEAALCRAILHKCQAMNLEKLFIGVDEVRQLIGRLPQPQEDETVVGDVTSALGNCAVLLEEAGVRCLVMVTALTETTFRTTSARVIEAVALPLTDTSSRKELCRELCPQPQAWQEALINAAGGGHMRSLVVACDEVAVGLEPDAHHVFQQLRTRLGSRLDETERAAIRGYVIDSIQGQEALTRNLAAEKFTNGAGAIPPALLFMAFDEKEGFGAYQHPAVRLFSVSAKVDAAKQLEECGAEYDKFRALYRLPAVPHGAPVLNTGEEGEEWYRKLCLDSGIARNVDTQSLFNIENRSVVLARSTWRRDHYVLPEETNHPWVDRAFQAGHPSGEKCMVIIQDKINKDSFSDAVRHLNAAADALSAAACVRVLCIAQVIGASASTRAQSEFKHPYVLVRDHEVEQFYSTFAGAIRFVRQRHML